MLVIHFHNTLKITEEIPNLSRRIISFEAHFVDQNKQKITQE